MPAKKLRGKPIDQRFWYKVNCGGSPDCCWEWQACRNQWGYGTFYVKGRGSQLANRVAWEITNGDIPRGLSVLHKCDNPICVNPNHLWLGTNADNASDKAKKMRCAKKLNKEHIRLIRFLYSKGNISNREIGERFGVNSESIRKIIIGKTWRYA